MLIIIVPKTIQGKKQSLRGLELKKMGEKTNVNLAKGTCPPLIILTHKIRYKFLFNQYYGNIYLFSFVFYYFFYSNIFTMQQETPTHLVLDHQSHIQENNSQVEKRPMIRDTIRMTTSTGFEVANWEKALEEKKKQSNRYYKGEQVSTLVDISHFKMYGPGIFLFFTFLWDSSVFFIILSFIGLMPMIYNSVSGDVFLNSATTFAVSVTKTSIGNFTSSNDSYNASIQHKLFNVIPDIVSCVLFLGFYFYWYNKSNKMMKQIKKQVLFPSYYAVQVVEFPKTSNPMMIEDFMGRFGTIKEVAPVRNYSEKIYLCKEIFQEEKSITELDIEMKKDQSMKEKNSQKIEKKQKKIQQLTEELNKLEETQGSKYIKFFVSYETIEERDQVVKEFEKYQKSCQCCRDPPPEKMLLNGQRVYVEPCEVQPGGILWENVHITWKTRWMRFFFQSLLLLILIVGGFLFISYLNIAVQKETYDSIDTSSYTSTTILSETNTTIVNTWCIKNIDSKVTTVATFCDSYWNTYYINTALVLMISVAIVAFKVVVKFIVIGVAKFQRYNDQTEESKNVMKNLMVTYISFTVLITFLMQANVFNISFKGFMSAIVTDATLQTNLSNLTQYSDLTASWYLDIGYQIWFNWFVLGLEQFVMPFVHYLIECLNDCLGRREVLHKNMVKKIQPQIFQIEDHYAHVLMIISIGFAFSGGMPMILVACVFSLLTRYAYFKFIFIRFCRVPPAYNEALNDEATRLLPITLIIHCLLSIYMYGGQGLFVTETSFLSGYLSTTDQAILTDVAVLLNRLINTWYLTGMTIIFIIVILLKNLMIDFILKSMEEKKKEKEKELQIEGNEEFQMRSQRTLTKSYKLEKNPDYFEIIAIMKMMEKKKPRTASREKNEQESE